MKLLFIFSISLISGNLLSQTHSGFNFWTGFGHGNGFGHWTGFGPHAHPGVGFGFMQEAKPMMVDVGEKPCLSYEPCEGPGYATGAGYGYGMTTVYTNDLDNETTGYGYSYYQRPYYNNYLNGFKSSCFTPLQLMP